MEFLESQLAVRTLIMSYKDNTIATGPQTYTGYLRGRIELLKRYWDSFFEIHGLLVKDEQMKDHDYYKQNWFSETEAEFSSALGYLYENHSKVAPNPPVQPISKPSVSSHLPKIQFPTFTVDLDEWEHFRDLFNALIENDQSLTSVQKLHYLKTTIQGEAKKVLEGLSTTESNYKSAWSLLNKRFDNKRRLINHHITRIVDHAAMKQETSSGLQLLLDSTAKARSSLETLKRPVSQWDDWLIFFVTRKLDPVTRQDWEKSVVEVDVPTSYKQLNEFLQRRIHALQSVEPQPKTNRPPSQSLRENHGRPNITVNAANTSTSACWCALCEGSHYISYCPRYTQLDPRGRVDVVKRHHLCYNCLRGGHLLNRCPSTRNALPVDQTPTHPFIKDEA